MVVCFFWEEKKWGKSRSFTWEVIAKREKKVQCLSDLSVQRGENAFSSIVPWVLRCDCASRSCGYTHRKARSGITTVYWLPSAWMRKWNACELTACCMFPCFYLRLNNNNNKQCKGADIFKKACRRAERKLTNFLFFFFSLPSKKHLFTFPLW